MKVGRIENDLRWNYGIEFRKTPYMISGYLLTFWIFKQNKVAECCMSANIGKGFLIDIEFALSDKIYSFRLPRIRSRVI